jgi:KDO2-lipid IV(A) lauroyltransferase
MERARRFALEARGMALVSALVQRLPRAWMLALARGLGRVYADLDRRHVAVAAANLRAAFPHWDEARVLQTARGVYVHFAQVLLDLLWMDGQPLDALLPLVTFEGLEQLEPAQARGRGAMMVTGHLGNWELHALLHAHRFGWVGLIARPLDNPALDARLASLRTRAGSQVISKRKALQQVLGLLRQNRLVAVLIDQNVQARDGIFVEFFARPAATTTVAAALAVKTGCALMPVRTVLTADGRYRLLYEPEVRLPSSGDRRADIARLTQALTARIEAWVREHPEQWLWIHRRWKTQPPVTATDATPHASDASEEP